MALDIAIRQHDFSGNEDRRWLKTREGFDTCRSITLDVSTFSAAHLTAKGAIPSGTVLAKITSGGGAGKYGPYAAAASDGRNAAVGFLFSTTVVGGSTKTDGLGSATDLSTAADVVAPLLWEGVISKAALPTFSGTDVGELTGNASDNTGTTTAAEAALSHCFFEA